MPRRRTTYFPWHLLATFSRSQRARLRSAHCEAIAKIMYPLLLFAQFSPLSLYLFYLYNTN